MALDLNKSSCGVTLPIVLRCQDLLLKVLFSPLTVLSAFKWLKGTVGKSSLSGLKLRLENLGRSHVLAKLLIIHTDTIFLTFSAICFTTFESSSQIQPFLKLVIENRFYRRLESSVKRPVRYCICTERGVILYRNCISV